MSFMQRQVEYGEWVRVDSCHGVTHIPREIVGKEVTAETVAPYLEHEADENDDMEVVFGHGARLSAPGYMDRTEWCVFETDKEAEAYLDTLTENE